MRILHMFDFPMVADVLKRRVMQTSAGILMDTGGFSAYLTILSQTLQCSPTSTYIGIWFPLSSIKIVFVDLDEVILAGEDSQGGGLPTCLTQKAGARLGTH